MVDFMLLTIFGGTGAGFPRALQRLSANSWVMLAGLTVHLRAAQIAEGLAFRLFGMSTICDLPVILAAAWMII
jgi:hypothetical protein